MKKVMMVFAMFAFVAFFTNQVSAQNDKTTQSKETVTSGSKTTTTTTTATGTKTESGDATHKCNHDTKAEGKSCCSSKTAKDAKCNHGDGHKCKGDGGCKGKGEGHKCSHGDTKKE